MKNDEILIRPFGLKKVFTTIKLFRNARKAYFPYQGIWVCSGCQGAGKTLYAVSLLRELKLKFPKIKIYSNINLYGIDYLPYTGIECFNDSNGEEGIVYLIDEIHCLYSSLESKKMSGSMLTVWSQNRKNKRLILGTSQRWTRVAKPIREQALFNIECNSGALSFIKKYRIIDASFYDDSGKLLADGRPDRWHFYIPNPEAMLMYDTFQVVQSTNELLEDGKK